MKNNFKNIKFKKVFIDKKKQEYNEFELKNFNFIVLNDDNYYWYDEDNRNNISIYADRFYEMLNQLDIVNYVTDEKHKFYLICKKDVDLITLDNQITDWLQEYIAPDYFEEKRIIQEQEDLKEYKDACYDREASNIIYFNNLL